MRVETNWKLVHRNKRITKYLSFFSVAVLIGSFILMNQPLANPEKPDYALALLPTLILPVAIISTFASVRMTNLWGRQPRPEQVIREALKGLNKKSVLYNYYHFPARHVIICPQGVFAIITRFQDGSYQVTGDRWRTFGGILGSFGRFFRRDDIGNPTQEAQRAAARVKELLQPIAPEIAVQPLVIFVDPRARLEITDPVVPALYADDKKEPSLKDYMRELAQQQKPKTPEGQPPKKKKGKPKPEYGFVIPPDDIEGLAMAFEDATFPTKSKRSPAEQDE